MGWGSRSSSYRNERYGGWAPYVPVAERRRAAAKKMDALIKKGEKITPVVIEGRTIASTFWGKSWCENLESYSDFANRLPRGRTYVRNGSVVDLKISQGKIKSLVSGSSLYKVEISIKALEKPRWSDVIDRCTGKVDSLLDLLQGKLSKGVMEAVTSKDFGLFPNPRQITLNCSCPDGALMCKHVAATLYGVGSRLDREPEVLFLLRGVDHSELLAKASVKSALNIVKPVGANNTLNTVDLGSLFGIEMDEAPKMTEVTKKAIAKKKIVGKKKSAVKLTRVKSPVKSPVKVTRKVVKNTSAVKSAKKLGLKTSKK